MERQNIFFKIEYHLLNKVSKKRYFIETKQANNEVLKQLKYRKKKKRKKI